MKLYENYLDNQRERRRLKKDGCNHIRIVKGRVVSYINKDNKKIVLGNVDKDDSV